MNSRRLARLMSMICDIKAHPRRGPEEMCRRFGVSRRQLYKDRDTLAEMGFSFHHSRRTGGFLLDKELTFNVRGLGLADLFALLEAGGCLARQADFPLAMGALNGLATLVGQLPEGLKPLFQEALERLVISEGLGCQPQVLETLLKAIGEGRRVVLVMDSAPGAELELSADPRRVLKRQGGLYLEAHGLEPEGTGLVALARIRRVIPTPFFSPPEDPEA